MESSPPKKGSSGATNRTRISLASLASGVSYSSMVRRLPAHIAEGLIRTIFEDRVPNDEHIKLVFIHELYLIQSIVKVTDASSGSMGNRRLVRYWHMMNKSTTDYLIQHNRLLHVLDEGKNEEELAESLLTLTYGQIGTWNDK